MPEITITPSDYISRIGRQAREASRSMARASTAAKNAVLERIAELLSNRRRTSAPPMRPTSRPPAPKVWTRSFSIV